MMMAAIDEAFEAVEDWEFQTRTGYHPAEMQELRRKLIDITKAS